MSVLFSARYSIVCLRGCHCDLCQRVLICWGKAVFGSSEWPKLRGAVTVKLWYVPLLREETALLCLPTVESTGTDCSFLYERFLTDLIHLEIKPSFPPPHGSFRTEKNASFPKDDNRKSFFYYYFVFPPWILMTGPSLHWLQMSQCFKVNEGFGCGKGLRFDFGQDVACAAGFHSHKGKTIICQSVSSVKWTICLWAYWKV